MAKSKKIIVLAPVLASLTITLLGSGCGIDFCNLMGMGCPPRQVIVLPDQGANSLMIRDGNNVNLAGGGTTPGVGDILVSTQNSGFLLRVDSVSMNQDGSVALQTSQATLADAVENGQFAFSSDLNSAKAGLADRTFELFSFSQSLNRRLYDSNGVRLDITGDINLNLNVDLQLTISDYRVNYFAAVMEGGGNLNLQGAFMAEGERQFGTSEEGIPLLQRPIRKYMYGLIGGIPVVIEATGQLYAGVLGRASGTVSFSTGFTSTAGARCGAEYRGGRSNPWTVIGEPTFNLSPISPQICLQGSGEARVFVRPVVELQLFSVLGPKFDLEGALMLDANGSLCASSGQISGAYEWNVSAGLAGHAKIKADILDRYVLESPFLTVFDRTWPLLRGSGSTPQPPASPSSPSPANGATGLSIDSDLDWGDANGATAYDVYFGSSNPPSYLGERSSSSQSLGTLNYSTNYYWRIVSKNSAGTTQGPLWSFTTQSQPVQPPATSSSPNPSNGATQQSIDVDLDWADASGATAYDVYFGTSSSPPYLGERSSSSQPLGTLSFNTTYYWRVTSKNSAGNNQGPLWSFTTQAQPIEPPATPSNPNPAGGATQQSVNVDLDWADAARATSYDVYFGTSNPPQFSGNVNASSYPLSTLSYGTTYYWKVVAKNTTGNTAGPVWSFTTEQQPSSTNIVADFRGPNIGMTNCSVQTVGTFFNNVEQQNNWRMLYPGSSSITITFSLSQVPSQMPIRMTHLTSASSGCQGGGYSPIDIRINGTLFRDNYDPAQNHSGSHGWVTDQWDVQNYLRTGSNTITLELEDNPWACTHYWIQLLSLGATTMACNSPAGQTCPVDYEATRNMAFVQHGPGNCENTGTEPGPSLEFYNVNLPATVSPGQTVSCSIDWNRCSDCNPNAVVYSTLVGNWSPSSPIGVRGPYFTNCGSTATDSFSFTAPTQPGEYRIRWIMCFAFDAVRSYCGEGPGGNVYDPDVCPYVEQSFQVCQ